MYKFLNKHKLIKDLHNLEEANLPDNAVMFKESKDVEAFVPFYKATREKKIHTNVHCANINFCRYSIYFLGCFFVNMGDIGTKVLSYCAFPFIFGVGDYINIVNTIRQVPKG